MLVMVLSTSSKKGDGGLPITEYFNSYVFFFSLVIVVYLYIKRKPH